jgi:hypothetical protein
MAVARIFQQSKNAMQSGRANADVWVLEFESDSARRPDPLTGWAGGSDTQSQVRLKFQSLDEARAYADRNGIACHLVPPAEPKLKLQAYADNFR